MFDFLSKAGESVMDGLSNVGSAMGEGLSTVGEYAGAGLGHIAERMQDPEFQQQARLFSAVMSNDNNRYQGALNAYDQRKAEIAKQKREDMQRAEARAQKLEDLKNQYAREDGLRAEDREWKVSDKLDDRSYTEGREDYKYDRSRADGLADKASDRAYQDQWRDPKTATVDNSLYQFNRETGKYELAIQGTSTQQAAADKKVAEDRKIAEENSTAAYNTAQSTLDAVRGISKDDVANVGGYSTVGGLWSEGSKSSAQKFNQVLSQQFMQNITQMKGMGSLSNAEGSKVTGAATALVDPETNAIKLGLDEKFVQQQLDIIEKGALNLQKIAQFQQRNGREPNIEERKQMGIYSDDTPAFDPNKVKIRRN